MNIRKRTLPLALMALASFPTYAIIHINAPSAKLQNINIEQVGLDKNPVAQPANISLSADGTATFSQADSPIIISITAEGQPIAGNIFSNSAADDIVVTINTDGTVSIVGTPLAEGVNKVDNLLAPYLAQFSELNALYGKIDEKVWNEQMEKIDMEANNALISYAQNNAHAPEIAYLLRYLSGEDFMTVYNALSPTDIPPMLSEVLEAQKNKVQKRLEAERVTAQLESGSTPAPAFTLPDLEGKQVSLSDFKGKWVILDFWGSWCRWCIKGFPELKELSALYGDKINIIGIDCRDTQQKWKEAVAKYELTWTNLYNDCSSDAPNPLLESYAVQGFPTKVIIDPQGVIRKIVVGADPEFPNILASFIGE